MELSWRTSQWLVGCVIRPALPKWRRSCRVSNTCIYRTLASTVPSRRGPLSSTVTGWSSWRIMVCWVQPQLRVAHKGLTALTSPHWLVIKVWEMLWRGGSSTEVSTMSRWRTETRKTTAASMQVRQIALIGCPIKRKLSTCRKTKDGWREYANSMLLLGENLKTSTLSLGKPNRQTNNKPNKTKQLTPNRSNGFLTTVECWSDALNHSEIRGDQRKRF